jgi:hypothetical protein
MLLLTFNLDEFSRVIAVGGQTEGISGSSISFSVVDSTS